MDILNNTRHTIRRYGLIKKNDRVLAGVSGGADSVALLLILHQLSRELNLRLAVAHLDHGLRRDSASDRKFVQALAARLGVDFHYSEADLKNKQRGSLEELARNRRIEYFIKVARRTSADAIALGHTLDDQAETVLMRILRGTGLYGLAGISPLRRIKGVIFIRPLIEVRRKEIEAFLKRRKQEYRSDSTNDQDIYFRNRIRKELLPLLAKRYNPRIKEALANLAESSSLDYDYLACRIKRAPAAKARRFGLPGFMRLHPSMRRLLLRNAYSFLKGDTRRLTLGHIKEIEDMARCRPYGSVVDLPLGIRALKRKKAILFSRRKNGQ